MKQEVVAFVVERITLEKTDLLSVNHGLYILVGWGTHLVDCVSVLFREATYPMIQSHLTWPN